MLDWAGPPNPQNRPFDTKADAKISETIVITLMTMFIDGPEVSLNGSPMVSPTTAALCASEPLPPNAPASMNFLATDPQEFAIGQYTIECSVTDSGGYTGSTSFLLDVIYPFDVVILPLKGNITAGSTVPVDWYYTLAGDPAAIAIDSSHVMPEVAWFGPFTERTCTTGSDGSGDGAEDSGSSSIRYSGSDRSWRLNWQTPPKQNWYNLVVSPPGSDASSVCVRLR